MTLQRLSQDKLNIMVITGTSATTPSTLEEVLALPNEEMKIYYLMQGRRFPNPDPLALLRDWDPRRHKIMDPNEYKKIRVLKKPAWVEYDDNTKTSVQHSNEYEEKEPNRIALPIEQDQVNIHTAFTVGTEPTLDCTPADDSESALLGCVKRVFNTNKLKYQNRQIVRSWLSETEVAEYWYIVPDDGFWPKLKKKYPDVFGNVPPMYKLKCQVWSPFRGDTLYPFYDDGGNLVAFSRRYKTVDLSGAEHECFMTVTDTMVYQWDLSKTWQPNSVRTFKHGFTKLPVIYAHRPNTLCEKIRPIRERLEKCLSGYADCIDFHFFPILMLFGDLDNVKNTDMRNRIMQMTGTDAKAEYLTWDQASDPVKVEIDTYFNQAYALTNTPRISFDQIKGTTALSGVAFRYVFMGIHAAVENHAEELGQFFQRRVNFIISALGSINTTLWQPSKTLEINTEIVPYIIDSVDDKVTTAAKAVEGGVWSTEHGVAFCSDYGETKDEVEQIMEEKQKTAQPTDDNGQQTGK